ncbi:polysaccharide deacetylase family protein [Piscicoccus intestinalis]|uniref:polysaccharide deacetylase family protein n=1 Tax=Piscicoccus intestinalis TaxID=746033 RepID=UPI0008395234|nr:polysaccharide deacetylase family protein [Piscicoccus intestinalis]
MPTRRTVLSAAAAAAAALAAEGLARGLGGPLAGPLAGALGQPSGGAGGELAVGRSEASASGRPARSAGGGGERLTRARAVADFGGRRPRQWGLRTSGAITSAGPRAVSAGRVVLTFDACGGPAGSGYDAALIGTLRRLRVPATLFLNARWIAANRSQTRELAADPLFKLASHGWRHLPLSVSGRSAYGIRGTGSVAQAYDELTGATPALEAVTGTRVRWFRPGTAYCDEVAAALAHRIGTPVVGFSVNGDAGATFSPAQVASAVGAARPGDIVIAHLNHPAGGTARGYARALPRLLDAGVRFGHLDPRR